MSDDIYLQKKASIFINDNSNTKCAAAKISQSL